MVSFTCFCSQIINSFHISNSQLVVHFEQMKTHSKEQAKLGAQQWKNAQESLLSLEKSNVASMDEIVRLVQIPKFKL